MTATPTLRRVSGANRQRRFAFGALALTAGVVTALAGTAVPALAATSDVSTGTLNWAVNSSWNSYVLNPAWGVTTPPAAITAVAPSTTLYTFPGASGSVTSATAADVRTTGGAHWVLPAHGIDETLENLRVVVTGTHADLYADISYSFTAAFGSIHGTPANPEVGSTPNVLFATSDSASIVLAGGGATISIPGSSIFGTTAGVAAGFLYGPGGVNNNAFAADLTLTATLGGVAVPTIALSKSTLVNPDGDTIHVTGTGFVANLNATTPPLAGHPAGFYVAFGKFASTWKPSDAAPSSARATGAGGSGLWWVVPQASYDYVASVYGPSGTTPNAVQFSQFVLLQPDGSFELNLTVADTVAGKFTPESAGNYGVYTYQTGGGLNAAIESYTPISFASWASSNAQTITAEITHSPGGALTWTIPSNNPVALGGVVDHGSYLQSTGEINPVTVTDTRTNQGNAWTLSGQLGDFSDGDNSFDGKYLGWSPKVVTAGAGATIGGIVASGWDSGNGLKGGAVLGSASDGHDTGSGTLGADLTLKVPVETPAGSYTATLTLTTLG